MFPSLGSMPMSYHGVAADADGQVVIAATAAQGGARAGIAPIKSSSAAEGRVAGQSDALAKTECVAVVVKRAAGKLNGALAVDARPRHDNRFLAEAGIAA